MDRRTYLQIRRKAHKFTPDLLRTFLANERTFLAFIRTSLTLVLVAFTFIKFVDNVLVEITGWALVAIGIMTFFVGLTRYLRTKILIRAFHSENSDANPRQNHRGDV